MMGLGTDSGGVPLACTILVVLSGLALVSCSGQATFPPTPTSTPPATLTPTPSSTPTLELTVQVISTDLSIGPNRLAFALLEKDFTHVSVEQAQVSTYHPGDSPTSEPSGSSIARFRSWPVAGTGVYTTMANFDRAGTWGIVVGATGRDGTIRYGQGAFRVKEQSATPAIGSIAPPTENKTAGDVSSLEELTTASSPDPELYSMTIADALESGKPLVVAFATPAFCTSATCGPQVEVIEAVKERYRGRVNFIHVEIFDNPVEMRKDVSKARTAAAVEEWGLASEPWTFIVDEEEIITAKFEAYTTAEEIEDELERMLMVSEVRGLLVEVESVSLTELDSLVLQDGAGKCWTFRAAGFIGITPSHLREHMALALPVTVRYRETADGLLVVEVAD